MYAHVLLLRRVAIKGMWQPEHMLGYSTHNNFCEIHGHDGFSIASQANALDAISAVSACRYVIRTNFYLRASKDIQCSSQIPHSVCWHHLPKVLVPKI